MQEIPVKIQSTYFFITVGLGIAVGLLFDIHRTCRYFKRPRRHVAFVLDLLFCLVVTVVVYAGLLLANWGEVRLYVFVGMFLGLALYYLTVSHYMLLLLRRLFALVLALLNTLCRLGKWGALWLIRLISIPLWPFLYLGRLLRGCFGNARGRMTKSAEKVGQKIKKFVNIFPKRKS